MAGSLSAVTVLVALIAVSMFVETSSTPIRDGNGVNSGLETAPISSVLQGMLDNFCVTDRDCTAAVLTAQLFARFDTNARGDAKAWRCYAPSTLSPDHSHYVTGTAYCTRPALGDLVTYSQEANTTFVDVFTPGESGYPCIRIPSIVLSPDNANKLIAFAECRNWTGDGCEPHGLHSQNKNRDICKKTSVDGGETWGPLSVIIRNAAQPTPVIGVPGTGQILLQYVTLSPGENYQVTSDDDGETWSAPQSMAAVLGKAVVSDVGPGVGLQLRAANTPWKGRLLFIGHHGAYQYDSVWYSDDGGATYQLSKTDFSSMDEAQLVELPSGAVLANMRNNHLNATCKCRAVSISTDGGASFGPVKYDPTLISPVCMATIMRPWLLGDDAPVLFANPATTSGRVKGTLRRSSDGTHWTSERLVWGGDFAYSCLGDHPDPSMVGLLWETSGPSCRGESCKIVYSVFPNKF